MYSFIGLLVYCVIFNIPPICFSLLRLAIKEKTGKSKHMFEIRKSSPYHLPVNRLKEIKYCLCGHVLVFSFHLCLKLLKL